MDDKELTRAEEIYEAAALMEPVKADGFLYITRARAAREMAEAEFDRDGMEEQLQNYKEILEHGHAGYKDMPGLALGQIYLEIVCGDQQDIMEVIILEVKE
jgi:hypothetical protein